MFPYENKRKTSQKCKKEMSQTTSPIVYLLWEIIAHSLFNNSKQFQLTFL